jgi:hypothetical protein
MPDSGRKHIVKLQDRTCDYKSFYKYQAPCAHAITACRYDGIDPILQFNSTYTLKVYRKTYREALPPLSIENLASDPRIQSPVRIQKRGRPKTKRHWKGEHTRLARKCGKCGEIGHNTRTCTGLRDRAGRGERARQWRQEQEAWEEDVMMEAIEQEVEAQVRREAGDGDVDIDSDSELSLLQSSDFEGMEL